MTQRPNLQSDQQAANAAAPHAESDASDLAYQEYCERVQAEQDYMEDHGIDPEEDTAGWYADFEAWYYGEAEEDDD